MGDVPEKEQAWLRKAHAEQLRCKVCNQLIPYGEQDVYFSRGLCSLCAHNEDEDD